MPFLKKALGMFVEFKEEKPSASGGAGTAGAGVESGAMGAPGPEAGDPGEAAVLPDAPEDLSQHPDVVRVDEAIALLSSLPLESIPADKARELILRTLQFAGMNPQELLGSFQRAERLYQAQITGEQSRMEARAQQNRERLTLLEGAIAEEKAQYEAEIAARTGRVEKANQTLTSIAKAVAFFAAHEEPGTNG